MLCIGNNHLYGQLDNKCDSSVLIALQGKTGPSGFTVFPLATDAHLKNSRHPVVYSLLVVNNLIIRDEKMVNYFRNHFDKTKIV